MPVRSIEHQGRQFYFGRRRPAPSARRPALRDLVTPAGWSAGPTTFDYRAAAAASLDKVYLNNAEGDCVIAAMAHTAGLLTANAGVPPLLFTDAQINRLYNAIGGYIPGNPATDNGCDEITAMNYWQRHGLLPGGSHKIAGWLTIDAANIVEIRTAAWVFENLLFGMELPDAWIVPFPNASGFMWDAAGPPNPQNGHAFPAVGWTHQGAIISTWGITGVLTYRAIQKYAVEKAGGEVHVVVSPDSLNRAMAKEPIGLNWAQMTHVFAEMGGLIP